MKSSTIVAATAGTTITAFAAYALYFDYRRRTDPVFRKSLLRDKKREAKAAKEEAAAESTRTRDLIKRLVKQTKEEMPPASQEEMQEQFMIALTKAEKLGAEEGNELESALYFYQGLKLYPAPRELIQIIEKTTSQSVLEMLSQFIALDDTLDIEGAGGPGGGSGSDMD